MKLLIIQYQIKIIAYLYKITKKRPYIKFYIWSLLINYASNNTMKESQEIFHRRTYHLHTSHIQALNTLFPYVIASQS